jgi:hypothetical protein
MLPDQLGALEGQTDSYPSQGTNPSRTLWDRMRAIMTPSQRFLGRGEPGRMVVERWELRSAA